MKNKKPILVITTMTALLLTGCSFDNSSLESMNSSLHGKSIKSTSKLANLNYKSGNKAYKIINNDQPTSIKIKNFNKPHIKYSDLDDLQRARTATAYLTKTNVGKSEGRDSQTFKPTGWQNQPKQINGKRIYPVNRGHLIAYTISFNLNNKGKFKRNASGSIDNPKNLITQTSFSNQKTMQITESKVRNALYNGNKIIYKVSPVYRKSEAMARGVQVQGLSLNGKIKFNRYIYNVQPNLKFNYMNGLSKIDNSFKVPTPYNYENYNSHYNTNKWNYKNRYGR